MDNKKLWIILLGLGIFIVFIICTFKFKWYDKGGFYMFLFLCFGIGIILLLMLKPFNPDRKNKGNAEVMARVKDLCKGMPQGEGLEWGGGAGGLMRPKDYKKENEWFRFWGIIAKGKDGRYFRVIYWEKDDIVEIDGATSSAAMSDPFYAFEPFKNQEHDLMAKMMMQNGMGQRRPNRRRTIKMIPTSLDDYEKNNEMGDEQR